MGVQLSPQAGKALLGIFAFWIGSEAFFQDENLLGGVGFRLHQPEPGHFLVRVIGDDFMQQGVRVLLMSGAREGYSL